eukprot:GHRQ01011120.1.p2 GENE.GHRQ01011120.1~~GHRQ01011120.1.p2  ORF type:complete len:121 (+),score=37.26 GHRQ01011120.1:73-435(+)
MDACLIVISCNQAPCTHTVVAHTRALACCVYVLRAQVQFPERPGALRRFLDTLASPEGGWNVTLFHYRCTGNRQSYVMLGLQVPPEQGKAWRKATKSLQDEFTFEELAGEERRVFNMFIQ